MAISRLLADWVRNCVGASTCLEPTRADARDGRLLIERDLECQNSGQGIQERFGVNQVRHGEAFREYVAERGTNVQGEPISRPWVP